MALAIFIGLCVLAAIFVVVHGTRAKRRQGIDHPLGKVRVGK